MNRNLLYTAWKRLILVFLFSHLAGLAVGAALQHFLSIAPQVVFELSTKRLSYALPVMDAGVGAGIDHGIVLFVWNAVGALVTLSFIHTALFFNPLNMHRSPRAVRHFFCRRGRMKLLCFLPGCMRIKEESLRRVYVWLMVPLLGMILLGMETGLSASTARHLFGSYLAGTLALLPHGIFEIPAIALAGAVTFSAHLLIKPTAHTRQVKDVFRALEKHRGTMPIRKIALAVTFCLLIAGFVEAHISYTLIAQ